MEREALFAEIVAARPGEGDIVYVERRGDDFSWRLTPPGGELAVGGPGEGFPDVWIYWSGDWPLEDAARQQAVFDDLIAEMESMGGGSNRCRWDLDDPWPHSH
jgi:hypothetical protein